MKSSEVLVQILVVQLFVIVCVVSQGYDFLYFVQQWPGSYCDSDGGCCYPTTGKPATNFSIHGLWPNYDDGSYPSYCNDSNAFDESLVTDLLSSMYVYWDSLSCPSSDDSSFWAHEWDKHGTCVQTAYGIDEHDYFAQVLNLKMQVDVLGLLEDAGIYPDGSFYSVEDISNAIAAGFGYTPGMDCVENTAGNATLLYEIYLCVSADTTTFIECPILPDNTCTPTVEFPSF